MTDSLSIAVHAFVSRVSMSFFGWRDFDVNQHSYVLLVVTFFFLELFAYYCIAQSAGAVEYTDCTSTEK